MRNRELNSHPHASTCQPAGAFLVRLGPAQERAWETRAAAVRGRLLVELGVTGEAVDRLRCARCLGDQVIHRLWCQASARARDGEGGGDGAIARVDRCAYRLEPQFLCVTRRVIAALSRLAQLRA